MHEVMWWMEQEQADHDVHLPKCLGSPEGGSETPAKVKADVEPVERVIGSEDPDVLVGIGFSHAFCGREQLAFRQLGDGSLRLSVRLQRSGDKGNIDESSPLGVQGMPVLGVDPLEQADIDVFVRMVPSDRIACGCRTEDLQLGGGEQLKEVVLKVLRSHTR